MHTHVQGLLRKNKLFDPLNHKYLYDLDERMKRNGY